jgi:hypothetical protein
LSSIFQAPTHIKADLGFDKMMTTYSEVKGEGMIGGAGAKVVTPLTLGRKLMTVPK